MRCVVVWCLGLALVVHGGAPLGATTILRKDVVQLVDEAEAVVVGEVVAVESMPTADGSFAFTFVTLQIERTLKGVVAEAKLTLRLAGGEVGGEVFTVEGMPRFEMGHRYVLFVADNGRAAVPIVGWTQGQLELVKHPRSGEEILLDTNGQALAGLRAGVWRLADINLDRDELIVAEEAPAVVVLEQEGVVIEPVSAPLRPAARAAAAVLADLERLVAQRVGKAGSRPAAVVGSASLLEVPATFQFRAQRESVVGGVR